MLFVGFAKSSHSLVFLPKISIGSVTATVKDEKTMQQMHEDMTNENVALELNFQTDIKQEALCGHVFF
jgi:hypothetical protein